MEKESGTAIPDSLTDRMALVVSDATPSEAHAMEEAVASNAETRNDKILASESYNIDFTLCRQQVVMHGAKVSVKIGFPGNYDANSDVTYKVYHFVYDDNGDIERVEEIPCVVTQYGLIAYCDSFSPYMVVDTGLMTGVSADSWAPDKTLTRAEAACVLFRLDDGAEAAVTSSFADIANGAWYAGYVSYCAEKGYMNGYPGNTFAPSQSITREEFVTILYRMAGSPKVEQTLSFGDASSISSWAKDAVQWAVSKGILIGDNNGNLNPKNNIRRCEVATVLQRELNN